LYVSGEEFTNQFLLALRDGKLEEFRRRFRSLDVLVVDDIHFLANKRATQEEFLHTYNAIEAAGKQVVLASDTHPKLMGRVPETLVSRFVCGMVLRIDPPDCDTRCEILRRRASKLERAIPEDVIGYIAANLRTNVRELEGSLLRLLAYASVVHEAITVEMARQALADYLPRADRIVTVNDIENRVATFFGLSPAQLHSSRKTRAVALARAISMYLARKYTSMSFPEIGRLMGNKNHSTVILACRKIERTLAQDAPVSWEAAGGVREMKLRALVEQMEEELGRS
jgi:chromosomal replication initiator protein